MKIAECLWLPYIIEKLASRHGLQPDEVEETFLNVPRFYRVERGERAGEDLYAAYGQTNAGRYIVVFFELKIDGVALVISARDMTVRERRRYARK
ncbi:MAG: hypothetical protein BroJett021_01250 [Chloroflexota bacterium]|nr:MAG: hypothetical protein BroJett021_01250 [Chloroflexota bacterium]